MKKLLLSMAAGLLCAGSALADTTVTFADLELGANPTEFTAGTDFKFVADQNGGTTKPAYNANNKDLRLYAKNTLTVTSGADITSMVFNISKQGKKRLTDITASNGNVTISNPAEGDWTVTWTGSAAEVTFTVGEKATYGTDGESKAGQFCFTSMNIVGGGELGGITPPEPAEPTYFKATAVESGQSYVFVAGGMYNMLFEKNYGYMSSTNLPAGATATSFAGDASYALKFTAVQGGYTIETAQGKMLGAKTGYKTFDTTDDSADNRVWTVSFDAGVATITNIATGHSIYQDPAFGSFGCYLPEELPENAAKPELFKLQGEVVIPPVNEAIFVETAAIASGAEYVMVANDKLGTVISESSTFGRLSLTDVTITNGELTSDVKNAITIKAEGEGYTMKDSYGRYLGFDGTHTTSFQLYTEVSPLCIWTISFTAGKASISLTAEGNTGLVGVTKGAEGTWYNNIAPSVNAAEVLLPTLFVKKGSGLESVAVDNEAPVEFYNLQGVRVANPEAGIYIRRQGSNVTKVYVR